MRLHLPPAPLAAAVRAHLKRGGVIAYPTESCYGLGCDPRNPRAVARLLALKGRPRHKGLILIADRLARLAGLLAPLSDPERATLAASWPGPNTWLLPASRRTPSWLTGGRATLAVRLPAHALALGLCRAVGMPLVSTSANPGGLRPARTARACVRYFGTAVLLVPGPVGRRKNPSTIRDLRTGRVIRG